MSGQLWKVFFTALAFLVCAMPARAAYSETDEQRDHAYRHWTVAATSPDRRWLGHAVDLKLVILDTATLAKRHDVYLPFALVGLAIDNSGDRVVGVATRGCVVIIELSRTSPPSFSWLPGLGWVNDSQGLQPCSMASVKSSWLAEQFLPPQQPVSLDAASRRAAVLRTLPDHEKAAQVVDLTTGAVQIAFPTGLSSGEMNVVGFRDEGKTLLVSSDASQALWNIETGELINFVEVGFRPFTGTVDGRSGRAYRDDYQQGIVELDAARCAEPARRWAGNSPPWETMHMSDSRTWYATADGRDISVFAAATHARLATFRAQHDVAWLFEDPQQAHLLAVSRSPRSDAGQRLPGFPVVQSFALPKPPAVALAATRPAKRCPAFAEHVLPRTDSATARFVLSAQTALRTRDTAYRGRQGSQVNGCSPSQAWGLTREGQPWIERYDSIERIDPRSGLVVQTVKTPRSSEVCSITWYARSGFLNWQGDTVSFRPFAGGRQVLAHRPGWRVIEARVDGRDHFVVDWARADFLDKVPTVTTFLLSEPDVGLAVRYRFDPLAVVGRLPSRVRAEGPTMSHRVELRPRSKPEGEDDWSDAEEAEYFERVSPFYPNVGLWIDQRASGLAGLVQWERSGIGAVRAFTRTKDSGPGGKTLLWVGLQGFRTDMPIPTRIDAFGPRAAIVMESETATHVELYDALTRQRLATATIEPGWQVRQTAWLNAEATLLVDTCKRGTVGTPSEECALKLYAAP
jgi:hypothetical protein